MGRFLFLALLLATLVDAQNQIKTTIYKADGSAETDSVFYADGLARMIELHVKDVDEGVYPPCTNRQVVSAVEYDEAGRILKEIKPVYSDCDGSVLGSEEAARRASSRYYGEDHHPVYKEFAFSDDPFGRIFAVGEPGNEFALSGGNHVRRWYFGRSTTDFLVDPTAAGLDQMGNDAGAKYHLTVVKDENQNFVQTITDAFGRTLRTMSEPNRYNGQTRDAIVTEYQYDINNRLLKTFPPAGDGASDPNMVSETRYNTLGQVSSTIEPDAGIREMLYDKEGNLRFIRSERHSEETVGSISSRFHVIKYDNLNRIIEKGELTATDGTDYFTSANSQNPRFPDAAFSGDYKVKARYFYDAADEAIALLGIDPGIASELKNLRGKPVASATYDESGIDTRSHRVVDVYSYNDRGLVEATYKMIPTMSAKKKGYVYDLQHRLVSKSYDAGKNISYAYDHRGRMNAMTLPGSAKNAAYFYDIGSNLIKKDLVDGAHTVTADYAKNIRDWTIAIDFTAGGSRKFLEHIYYNSVSVAGNHPQFNGNISQATYSYPSLAFTQNRKFIYDGSDRLRDVVLADGSQTYEEHIDYDANGRIVAKYEGAKAGSYNYKANTNQVASLGDISSYASYNKKITGGARPNYVYDPNGNMVLDRSKRVVVLYDWRDMPVAFEFYASIPDVNIEWGDCRDFKARFGVEPASKVTMMYDASGNRVLKMALAAE